MLTLTQFGDHPDFLPALMTDEINVAGEHWLQVSELSQTNDFTIKLVFTASLLDAHH